VTWAVKNACPAAQTVTLGNFRAFSSRHERRAHGRSGAVAVQGSGFESEHAVGDRSGRTDGDIVLKEAKNAGGTQRYFFDICVGGVKVDPATIDRKFSDCWWPAPSLDGKATRRGTNQLRT
jgi:hypothetical protein